MWSGRLAVPVPLSLVILASWTGDPGVLAFEQATSAPALIACTASAARLLRAGARQTDVDADGLSKKMAAGDAAVADEEAERRGPDRRRARHGRRRAAGGRGAAQDRPAAAPRCSHRPRRRR